MKHFRSFTDQELARVLDLIAMSDEMFIQQFFTTPVNLSSDPDSVPESSLPEEC